MVSPMASGLRRACATAATLLLPLLSSCSQTAEPATQLILVADTDIDRIDVIEFRIEASGVEPKSARATRPADGGPVYLTLLREGGPLGPLTVTARGLAESTLLLSRTHIVSFVPEQTLVVPLHLERACIVRSCGEETCGGLECIPRELDEASLAPWSGAPPSLSSAGPLVQCEGDGMVDVTSDPDHCGACGSACTVGPGLQHSLASCVSSTCATSCEPLFGNCDNNLMRNGCEQNLRDNKHCGKCGNECGASQRCDAGVCVQK